MRHITPAGLDRLEPLLEALGALTPLKQKKRGVFYYRSRAFLHFHAEGDDIYADLRLAGSAFERYRCTTDTEQKNLLGRISKSLVA